MFRQYLSIGVIISLISLSGFTQTKCFILSEAGHTLKKEGTCEVRNPPCSTFKIALSLMGYDAEILTNEENPNWPFVEGYTDWLPRWKTSHNPKAWIKNSCVWYSQVLTKKIGIKKFSNYISKFKYGNQNISGDVGKNNGLTNCWLSSSLKISALEQKTFLEDLLYSRLPVSQKSHKMTRNILFIENLESEWKLYGKTGAGTFINSNGARDEARKIGWFIGWIEKGNRKIIFVQYSELVGDEIKKYTYGSVHAKKSAKEKLEEFIRHDAPNQN
ncbi:class D beta-lactamase [Alphaproteobacteria bacterium]|nr:class D beta-lactamase [Alphaproteobacteria bacterium]